MSVSFSSLQDFAHMDLTVADLAHAVGRSENYIRQHIHRGHLTIRREGRSVYVTLDEASRWARERGLALVSPESIVTTGAMERRTARLTLLTWQEPSAQLINLFTLIRHRRRDALGPWVTEPDGNWSCSDLGEGLRQFTVDTSFDRCQDFVDQITASGTLAIDGADVRYAVEPVPRRHWAYRNEIRPFHYFLRSPFARHSAEIIEYWSFEEEPRNRWREMHGSFQAISHAQLAHLGFPLAQRSDRVGNLMIAGAADEVSCELSFHRDQTLRLQVETDRNSPAAYRATVWASHRGDDVLREEVPIAASHTSFVLGSDVDRIGFAVYRTVDGQCVDLREAILLKEINIRMHLDSRPSLHLKDRRGNLFHTVTPRGSESAFDVKSEGDSGELDDAVRRLSLDWHVYEQEAAARQAGNLRRFPPSEFDQAASHVIQILRQDRDPSAPIYVADPYFMIHLDEKVIRLYLDMLAATSGRPLHILCGAIENEFAPRFASLPKALTNHVTVRAFLQRTDPPKPGFHDRYLITPEREILITNSFNGWRKHGVTFVSLPYGVYRAEAEQLWAMDVASESTSLCVEEIR